MNSKYHHKENKTEAERKRRNRKILSRLVILAVLLAFGFVYLDSRGPNNTPIVSTGTKTISQDSESDLVLIDEPTYSFSAPAGWEAGDRDVNKLYKTVQFKQLAEGSTAREMTVYIDTIPEIVDHKKVNRVLALSSNGSKFSVGATSDHCNQIVDPEITNYEGSKVPEPVEIDFNGRSVICDVNRSQNIVGTIGAEGYAAGLEGEDYQQDFFFVYQDHTARPNFDIFEDILRTFQQK